MEKIKLNIFCIFLSLLCLFITIPTYATVFTVTSTADAGVGTFRQAVLDANNDANAPHYIYFSSALSQGTTTILLSSNQITLKKEIHIDGYHNAPSNLTARAIANRTGMPVRISCAINYFIIVGPGSSNSSVSGLDIKMTYSGNSVAFLNQNVTSNNCHIWGCSFNYDFTTNARYTDAATNSAFVWLLGSVKSSKKSNIYGWYIGAKNVGSEEKEGNIIAESPDGDIVTQNTDNITVSGNYFGVKNNGLTPTINTPTTSYGIYVENGSGCVIGIFDKSSPKVAFQRNIFGGCIVPIRIFGNYADGGYSVKGDYFRNGNNKIVGNYIGADINGGTTTDFANDRGIYLLGSSYNTIGGNSPIEGNVISGVKTDAVSVEQYTPELPADNSSFYTRNFYPSNNNSIQYNTIKNSGGNGVLLNGSNSYLPTSNKSYDVCSYNKVFNNEIVNNTRGVVIQQQTTNGGYVRYNSIQGNLIHDNSSGIDLIGASLNTQKKGIDGNNGVYSSALEAVQEEIDKPVIVSAIHTNGSNTTIITGHVGNNTSSNPDFAGVTVEFYAADASSSDDGPVNYEDADENIAHGEGITYLGTTTTDANGLFTVEITNSNIVEGMSITAIATSNNGSSSEFGPNIPLTTAIVTPVTMYGFKAQLINNKIELSWSTASETNNKGWEVQRNNVPNDFENIGFVSSRIITGTGGSYLFIDDEPQYGQNYYRLLQKDLDGKTTTSNIVNVLFSGSINQSQNNIILYPNPVTNMATITGLVIGSRVSILNSVGQSVMLLTATTTSQQINLSSLPSGIYFVRIETNGKVNNIKFLKK